MGSGIAEVCARKGVDVTVVEADQGRADTTQRAIERSLGRGVKAGKLSEADQSAALERLAVTTTLEDVEGVDATVEAIVENAQAKQDLFARLDELLPDARFLASNTSSVPIMQIGSATKRPERVLGVHFFNPVPVMKLVELIPSVATAPDTLTAARAFAGDTLGKTPIEAPDRGGFIVNALLVPYLLSAIRMLEGGFGSREDIDTGMQLGCGHPLGPLRLTDLVGLDTTLFVADSLYDEFRDAASIAPPLLRRMVEAGKLGRKSGTGFYDDYGD